MNKNIDKNKFNENLFLIDEFWLGVSARFFSEITAMYLCGVFPFGVDENENE